MDEELVGWAEQSSLDTVTRTWKNYPRFIDQETEAERDKVTSPFCEAVQGSSHQHNPGPTEPHSDLDPSTHTHTCTHTAHTRTHAHPVSGSRSRESTEAWCHQTL